MIPSCLRRRAPSLGALALAFALLSPASPAAAQSPERPERSALADVVFPEPSWAWDDDPNGVRRAAVEAAALVADRSCGATEFHAWQVESEAAGAALREDTDATFEAAGWTLQDFSEGMGEQRIALAENAGAELVMTWMPVDSGVALLLCEAHPVGAAPAQTAVAPATDPAPGDPAPGEAADEDGLDLSQAPWAFFAGFAAIGVFVLGAAIRNRRRAAASLSWPTTQATILASDVVERVETDSEGDETEYYVPDVRYRYEVGGRTYEGNRLRFGDLRQHSDARARAMIAPYPAGSVAELRYDPAKPSESTLETTKPGLGAAMFIGGIFLVLAFLALIVALGQMLG